MKSLVKSRTDTVGESNLDLEALMAECDFVLAIDQRCALYLNLDGRAFVERKCSDVDRPGILRTPSRPYHCIDRDQAVIPHDFF